MIADSVAFLKENGQRGRLRRRALLRRLPRRSRATRCTAVEAAAAGGRRLDRALRHQRRQPARLGHARSWARCARAIPTPLGRPHPQRRRAGGGQRAGRGGGRLHAGAGHDQRLRRALRQREPRLRSSPPSSSRWATAACPTEQPGPPHRALAHGLRDREPATPTRTRPTSASRAFAHKGGVHVAAVEKVAASYEHIAAGAGGQPPPRRGLRAVRPRQRARARGRAGPRRARQRDGGRGRGSRSWRTRATSSRRPRARSSCWCAAAEPGYARALRDARRGRDRGRSGDGRRDAGRGHRQAARGRRGRAHRRRGRRARCTRSTARCARRWCRTTRALADVRLADYKVRILDPEAATGAQDARADRGRARRGALEHDRRVARTSSRPAGRRWRTAWSCSCCATACGADAVATADASRGRAAAMSDAPPPPRTLFQKLWDAHEVARRRPPTRRPCSTSTCTWSTRSPRRRPSRVLRERGLRVRRPERTVATMDHSTPTTPRGPDGQIPVTDAQAAAQIAALEENCREFGITLFALGSERQGIVHVIGPELGLTQPGMTIVCGDSHTAHARRVRRARLRHRHQRGRRTCWPRSACCSGQPKTLAVEVDGRAAAGRHRQGHRSWP